MELLRDGMALLYLLLEVRRENILEDTLNKIVNPGLNFSRSLFVLSLLESLVLMKVVLKKSSSSF